MSDDATPRLALPYLAAGQAQKHVTLNEALARLDGLVQSAVESRATDAQPVSPADGDLYIMTASASGADWAGKAAGTLMRFEAGAWAELTAAEGHVAWVKDEGLLAIFDGAAWIDLAQTIDALQGLSLLGINATADATNKLSVSSAAVLFNHAGAGTQLKVNKSAAGDTASHLFQTGFSGRAEFGLTGSDDFAIKVSADGSSWQDVFTVDRTTGKAAFARSAMHQTQIDIFTSSGSYSVPAWARRLRIVCIAAGGGGGSGAAGTNAADRSGGGGGGGGARSWEEYDVADLGATLTVTVGAGGSGGAGVTGTANGSNGGAGGLSSVADSGGVLLLAGGGIAGGGGTTTSGAAGSAAIGNTPGNTGGAGSIGAGSAGQDSARADGSGGGGGGGGLSTAGAAGDGAAGGHGWRIGGVAKRAPAGAAGVSGGAGAAGGDKVWSRGCGAGGGGGAASASANAGAGGAGGAPGGGGGGGGAARDTFTSGAGGAGGRGEVWIVAIG
ncbi:MAG TPA: DUF2793 domain-containing protein [Caulobacteraceae bacterium]